MQLRNKTALQKILEVIEETEVIIKDISTEEFLEKPLYKMAMTMSILRVGELVKNLTLDFRNEHNHVKWKAIAGFKDVIAHKYEIVDMNEVYDTVKKDFPELKLQIEKILADDK